MLQRFSLGKAMKVRFPTQIHRRFRVRALFLALAASAVVFAALGPTVQRYFVDRRWESIGADVWYYRQGKATGLVLESGHRLKSEDWDAMDDVFFVWFRGGNVTADEWQRLARLPNLITLDLGGAAIVDADLPRLRELPHLSHLYLDQTRVSDAGLNHLVGLDIEHLELEGTAISDAGLPILGQMHNLERLLLTGSKVSDDGLKALQKQLPKCAISK